MFTVQRRRRRVFFDSLKRVNDDWESARRDEHRQYSKAVEADLPGSFRIRPPLHEIATLSALSGIATVTGIAVYIAQSWVVVGWLAACPILGWSFWTVSKEATRRLSGRQSNRRAEDQLPELMLPPVLPELTTPDGVGGLPELCAPTDAVLLPGWEQPALPFPTDREVAS